MVFEVEGVQGEHSNNEKEGGEKMKKRTWFSMLALVVLFSLSIISVAHGERTEKEKEQIKELKKGAEIQELRLYIREGKIVYVEPINPKGYEIKDLPDLRGENIREGTALMIGQDSPVCTYWYYYWTKSGWEKICLH